MDYKAAYYEFIEKTEWVQQTVQPHELGLHRADILKDRIKALESRNACDWVPIEFADKDGKAIYVWDGWELVEAYWDVGIYKEVSSWCVRNGRGNLSLNPQPLFYLKVSTPPRTT